MSAFIESIYPNGTITSISKTYSERMDFPKLYQNIKILEIGQNSCYDGQATVVDLSATEIEIISYWAFVSCPISEFILPKTIKEIRANAFLFATIPYIYIPESLTTISSYAFNNAPDINWFDVDPYNAEYSSVNGFLMNKDKTSIVQVPRNVTSEIDFPPHTKIDIFAMTYSHINRYIATSNLSHLSYGAFIATKYLKLLDLSKSSVTSLPQSVVSSSSISTLILPHGLTELNQNTFTTTLQLQIMIIPEGLKSISASAFTCSGSMNILYLGTADFSNQKLFPEELSINIYVTPYYLQNNFGNVPVHRRWVIKQLTFKVKSCITNSFFFVCISNFILL